MTNMDGIEQNRAMSNPILPKSFKVGDKVKWTDKGTTIVQHGTIKSTSGQVATVETDKGIVIAGKHFDDLTADP